MNEAPKHLVQFDHNILVEHHDFSKIVSIPTEEHDPSEDKMVNPFAETVDAGPVEVVSEVPAQEPCETTAEFAASELDDTSLTGEYVPDPAPEVVGLPVAEEHESEGDSSEEHESEGDPSEEQKAEE